jgi:euchromatic histone-lysine N-methyltransferase
MNVVVLVENFVQKNYPPRRRVYAIRDFPPFYGSNVSSFNKKKVVVQKKC